MEALGLLWKFLSLGVKAILASRMFPSVTTESTLTGSNSNSSYRVQWKPCLPLDSMRSLASLIIATPTYLPAGKLNSLNRHILSEMKPHPPQCWRHPWQLVIFPNPVQTSHRLSSYAQQMGSTLEGWTLWDQNRGRRASSRVRNRLGNYVMSWKPWCSSLRPDLSPLIWYRRLQHHLVRRCVKLLQYYPRQWVDDSGPAYNRCDWAPSNPTHGSGWIVQVQPTNSA